MHVEEFILKSPLNPRNVLSSVLCQVLFLSQRKLAWPGVHTPGLIPVQVSSICHVPGQCIAEHTSQVLSNICWPWEYAKDYEDSSEGISFDLSMLMQHRC